MGHGHAVFQSGAGSSWKFYQLKSLLIRQETVVWAVRKPDRMPIGNFPELEVQVEEQEGDFDLSE